MDSIKIAKTAAEILDSKKGIDVKIICIRDVSVIADYFVIATGTSSTHVKALADELEFQLKKLDLAPNHIEGHRSNSWILLDYSDVVVHVFSEEARDFYDLERLWKDGTEIDFKGD